MNHLISLFTELHYRKLLSLAYKHIDCQSAMISSYHNENLQLRFELAKLNADIEKLATVSECVSIETLESLGYVRTIH